MLRIHLIQHPFSAETIGIVTNAPKSALVEACDGEIFTAEERFKNILNNLKKIGYSAELMIVESHSHLSDLMIIL